MALEPGASQNPYRNARISYRKHDAPGLDLTYGVTKIPSVESVGEREEGEKVDRSGKTLESKDHRLVLGFDAGCVTCSDLAKRVEEGAGEGLEVRSLYDPQVMHWREQTLGKDAPWAPTLIEIVGEDDAKAWTSSVRMGAALARRLGPAATWRVLRVLGESRGSEDIALPKAPTSSASSVTEGISRRQLLRGGLAGALVGISTLSGAGPLASRAVAAENAAGAGSVLLRSTGTSSQQEKAKAAVRSSGQFKGLTADSRQNLSSATVKVQENYALVALPFGKPAIGRKITAANFFVDLRRGTVGSYSRLELLPISKDKLKTRYFEDDQLLKDLTIEETPAGTMVTSDGRRMTPAEFYSRLSTEAGTVGAARPSPRVVGCATAISILCGTGGGIYCVAVCTGIGIVDIPAGVGCGLICAIISSVGCTAATNRLCG